MTYFLTSTPPDVWNANISWFNKHTIIQINIVSWQYFRCTFDHVKWKFFCAFNCIYAKTWAAGSEINTVELFKSYCIPHITYACEAIPFCKSDRCRLDNLIARVVCRIFNVQSIEITLTVCGDVLTFLT